MHRECYIRLVAVFLLVALLPAVSEAAGIAGGMAWPADVEGWKWEGIEKRYTPKTLFRYIDGAAEVYLAYNFKEAFVGRYEKQGSAPIVAEVYRMASSEDAFGVFSFDRQEPEAGVGQASEFGGGLLRFWKGRTFVSVFSDGEGAGMEAAVVELGRRIAAAIRETGHEPGLIAFLPDDPAPVAGTVRFLRSHILLNQRFFISYDNLLGLGRDVEAVLATYGVGGKKSSHLLVVRYPSGERARKAFQAFRNRYLHKPGAGGVKTDDGTWTEARHLGRFVIVVFQAPGQDEAERLLSVTQVRIRREGL